MFLKIRSQIIKMLPASSIPRPQVFFSATSLWYFYIGVATLSEIADLVEWLGHSVHMKWSRVRFRNCRALYFWHLFHSAKDSEWAGPREPPPVRNGDFLPQRAAYRSTRLPLLSLVHDFSMLGWIGSCFFFLAVSTNQVRRSWASKISPFFLSLFVWQVNFTTSGSFPCFRHFLILFLLTF